MIKALKTGAVIGVALILIVLIILSASAKPDAVDQAWNKATVVGDMEAKNHYIMYTDLMCPYCDVFSRTVLEHWDEFKDYLDEHKIAFEIRLTDYLYEGSDIEASRDAAEGAYCAMREDKFWDYYHGAIQALWDDYHSKGIGDSKTSPAITNMPDDYWIKIGRKAGLGEDFDNCMKGHETREEITKNTYRALQTAQGMPYFKFNKFTMAGFDNKWGWDYVLRYLDAGL